MSTASTAMSRQDANGAGLGADVVIVGGGIVGSTLALLLVEQARVDPARIALLEPQLPQPPTPGSPIGLRVSAISPAHRGRFVRLGAWQRLDVARIAVYERMAVWHESVPPDSPDVLRFDAAETDAADLGVIVENAALQAALLAACREAGVAVLCDRLESLAVSPGGVQLQLTQGVLHAELVVGADGAASGVRTLLGWAAATRDYGQRAIVATVSAARPHLRTAYQRFLATGPLALLPLPGDQCSIVWSATEARAQELLALPPPAFDAALTVASAGVLGELRLASERAAFPLRRLVTRQYVAPRVALAGDAAHVIHPLAGQGVNQGLEDAVALAAALAGRPPRESVGALAALRRYERERRAGNALVGGLVDSLDRLFTGSGPAVSWAARLGLAQVAHASLVRRFLARQAAGPHRQHP